MSAFVISPPFGAYFSHARATRVLGSYTALPRPGRTLQVLRTFRPAPGGWVNAIGLRNLGLPSALIFPGAVSLAPLLPSDWDIFNRWLEARPAVEVEFNLGCPNADAPAPLPPAYLVGRPRTTWKIPPCTDSLVDWLVERGARDLHLSNTLPSARGGVSGAQLRAVNLPWVGAVARRYPALDLTAGGGVYAPEHARAYRAVGAHRISLATAFMWPPRAFRILNAEN